MTIFMNNLKRIFGRPVNIVFMLVVPVLLNVFIISVSSGDTKYNIGVRDLDQSAFTKEIKNQMEEICQVTVIEESDDLKQMVLNADVDIAVEFEKGYTDGLIQEGEVKVHTYALNDTNTTDSGQMYLKSLIEAARVIGKAAGGEEQAFYDGMDAYYQKAYKVEYDKFKTSISEKVDLGVQSLGYVAFGMVFLMTFATMMILEDKLNGVYDRICVTPLSMFCYFMQNLFSFLIVAVIQIVLLFAILINWIGLSYGQTIGDVIETGMVCAAFAMVCISIGVIASRFAKTTLMATSVTTLVNMPFLMLGGCLWPRSIMPDMMQKIGEFVPTTWFLKASEQVMYGKGILSVWPYVGGMLVLSFVLIIIAYKVKTDKAR